MSTEEGLSFAAPADRFTVAERRGDGLLLEVQDQPGNRQVKIHLGTFEYPEPAKQAPQKSKSGDFQHAFIRHLGTVAVISDDMHSNLVGVCRLVACYTEADRAQAKDGDAKNLHLGHWNGSLWKKLPGGRDVNVPPGFAGFAGAKEYIIPKPFHDPPVAWGS